MPVPDNSYFDEEEFDSKFDGRTLVRIFGLVRPHWKWVAGFLLAVATVSILESYFTLLTKRIIDEAIMPADPEALKGLLATYIGIASVFACGVFSFIYLAGILGHRVQYDLRKKLFDHLQELSFSYFDRTPVGWIMSRLTSDTERIAELVTWGLLDTTWAVMNISTGVFFMLLINWRLAIIVVPLIPVLVVLSAWFKQKIIVQFRLARKINSKITGSYNENITGVRVVKALRREKKNLEEFGELTEDMYQASFRAAYLSALFLPTVQFVSAIALGIIVLRGGQFAQTGMMTIGGIQAFISYVTFMLWPIQDIARVYASMQQAIASAERTFSLVDTEAEIVDRPNAYDPGSIAAEIEFDQVEFYYEADKPVLRDFSLRVRQGETIAIVGPTGAGKSTIVNLICRFYEPRHGAIRIGGHDYTEFTLRGIQSRIGMVLQTPHLFSGTIRENIRYGRLEATDEEIIEAAKLAGAHDFIATLEEGYEAQVGEGGTLLSVGQKQLVSLARAVLAQPDIFIMDEATSSVDTLTEALIQQGMDTLMKRSTSFVIAHRLSTIKRADRILVLNDGRIEEMGSHHELLHQRGHYYRLYTKQFRDELEKQYDPYGSSLEAEPALGN
ncbi:MAG: ABC transporter ATP-binding protein/permease [Anaerolineae bacterium]|nr:ABC transporter ATP-binding protein/permease [Anaerolineae bacterium]